MRAEELAEVNRRQPFEPFRIHLTTGQTYDIRHPEFLWVQRQCADIAVLANPSTGVVDHVERISLLHIVRIERVESASRPTRSNGDT